MYVPIHANVTLTDVSKVAFEGCKMARGSRGGGSGRGVTDHGPPGEDRRWECQGQSTYVGTDISVLTLTAECAIHLLV